VNAAVVEPQRVESMAPSVRRPRATHIGLGGSLSLIVLLTIIFVALAAPILTGYDPTSQDTAHRLLPPAWAGGSTAHFLGTDQLGRDTLTRLYFGSRTSLVVGFVSVTIAGTLGLLLGLVSGYVGGLTDSAIQSIAYAQLAMPFVLLAVAVAAVFGPSFFNLIVVLVIAGWVSYQRVVRGLVISTKNLPFIEAARALGMTHRRILFRHILPQVTNAFLVLAALQVGWMILLESALSYLGLGIQPPTPTWGGMISQARDYIQTDPWISVFPGIAIAITVLSVNGAALWFQDVLDPLRSRR
jgi:peptide/nickel transport system permease protein